MPREIVVCMYLRTEEGIELDMSLHHPIYSTCMHSSFFPRGEITANQAPSPSSLRPFGIRFFAVQRKWVLAREGERDSAALRYICRRGHFSPPEGRRTDHHAQSWAELEERLLPLICAMLWDVGGGYLSISIVAKPDFAVVGGVERSSDWFFELGMPRFGTEKRRNSPRSRKS